MMATLNIEECELLGDSKYRAYISQVEKALRSFENTSEWADLISALGKLNKVLTHHVRYPIIPKRVTIGKRLAQCLHPVLPSGVHLKVLETYDIIFKCIGTQRLAGDLFTYSAGLFPLLAYSAMNVKPALLSLFENHFVPLGRHIRPAMTGILQGLLPGLEEASEHHDRTNNLLEEFCEATNSTYFYGCLWDIVLANPSIRLSAINFVLAHFNRKQTMEDQLHLMGTNIDTMVEALCVSVQDASVLVQRSALDLVLVGFPVHNSQLTRQDMVKVATAVIKVLLRRDMSLNRRLYAWILGTDASGAPLHLANQPDLRVPPTIERLDSFSSTHEYTAGYFNIYSKELLVRAVKNCIREGRRGSDVMSPDLESSLGKAANLRPFKILMSLLDKPEIGPIILEDMLIDIFRYTYKECVGRAAWEDAVDGECSRPQASPDWAQDALHKALQQKCVQKAAQSEVIKMANLLFGAFEPYFMWDFIGRAFEKACSQQQDEHMGEEEVEEEEEVTFTELTVLVNFLLDKVPLETFLETQTEHLPELLRQIMGSLQRYCDKMTDRELVWGLELCSKILTKVQPSVTPAGGYSSGDTSGPNSPVRQANLSPTSPVKTWRRKTESESDLGQPGVTLKEQLRCQSESNVVKITDDDDSSDSGVEEPHKDHRDDKRQRSVHSEEEGEREKDGKKDGDGRDNHRMNVEYGKKEEDGKKKVIGKKEKDEEKEEDKKKEDGNKEDGEKVEEQKETDQSSGDAPVTSTIQIPSEESFSDFVQYEVSGQTLDGVRLPRKQVPRTLMQACVESFQGLFHTILLTHIIKDTQLSDIVLDQLCKEGTPKSPPSHDSQVTAQIPLENLSDEVSEAFDCACQLLVDFSSFPMYCIDQMRVLRSSASKEDDVTFPDWLKLLITCSCFLNNFAIQTTAISTMLDLIGLTLSTMDDRWSSGQDVTDAIFHGHHRDASVGQTVSVVIVPSVTQAYLGYIDIKTHFYTIVARRLWHYLGEDTVYGHQRCVDLMYQLHQLAPTRWHCEDVIGNTLLSDDKNEKIVAHKKFSILWNLLRDKTTQGGTPQNTVRSFDRSMFVMLDSLQMDTHPCHVVTQTWLSHALQRGDIARLLEPLLLILLHPDTARISIQHVNIHQPKRVRLSVGSLNDVADSAEAKIYAISSEGGNVMYHVSNGSHHPSLSKRPDRLHTTFAVMSVTDGHLATHTARTLTDMEFHFDKVNPHDLNVRVNPFIMGESPVDRVSIEGCTPPSPGMLKDIHNARRLDAETCRKEGIFFDEEDEGGDEVDNAAEATEDTTETAEDVVDSILQEVIDSIFETADDVDNDTESTYDDSSSVSSRTSVTIDQTDDAMDDIKESLLGMPSKDYNNSVVVDDLFTGADTPDGDIDMQSGTESEPWPSQVHPLHTHILLYSQKYDAHRTLYALSTFKSMLAASPKLVCAMATTSVCNTHSQHLEELHKLLIQHRRSVFGKNFFGEITNDASLSSYHSNMYVEILISICLYFVRSYYPNLMSSKLTSAELEANKQVQILSCEVLTLLLSELASLTRNSGKGFATYISDLLVRCKVQKALLHCLLASVHNARQKVNPAGGHSHFTDVIVSFNEDSADTSEVFQAHLLKLVRVVIILEEQIRRAKSDADHPVAFPLPPGWEKVRVNFQPSLTSVQYQPAMPVICQGMLLSAVLSALRQQHLCYVHQHWIAMVTSVMPYMGRALSVVVTTVVGQLCHNIEQLAQRYEAVESCVSSNGQLEQVPPDHVISLLEEMTSLCHYCLLDSGQQEVSLGQSLAAVTNNLVNDTATNLLTNLLHVFTPSTGSREPSPVKETAGTVSPVVEARKRMLGFLPRIISSLAQLWKVVGHSESRCSATNRNRKDSCWRMGAPKTVRQYILEFLSPVSRHHPVNLLAAIAVIWNDWRKCGSVNVKKVVSIAGDDQLLLVELVSAIKVLPMDTLIQTIKQVIKQPPMTIHDTKRKPPLGISMLQFCYAHIQHSPGSQLLHSWPAMLSLLKDALQLAISPPAQFLLLAILNEFVQKIPMFEDRKDQKDLQEIAQKFLEACSEIAGASLEVTTWLSRNLAVKPGPQIEVNAEVDEVTSDQGHADYTLPTPQPVAAPQDMKRVSPDWNYQQYSVQALVMLADITAPLLDVVYRSEEKDKVVPFLSTIMHNVFPYLRNHRSHNLPSFRTCSQMLASLSGYQYTRKAWKREVFDLLLDPTYFQMDEVCIGYWRIVIDNLMTHDRTTFRDLLARVIVTPVASLNLFSSREQEFEQRALLLKRLNFTIFCSDVDQYHKFMPDIQERTSESLKVPTVPSVQAQVFMAFRVLMLRMSPHHLTSLWPTIITELVHVLLLIEQELCPDLEEMTRTQLSRLANLDPSWALGNGLNTHKNPSWLQLYLAACKLLDLALVLPTSALPQFQLYRWAFLGDPGSEVDEKGRLREQQPRFTPHVFRIAKLMNKRFGEVAMTMRRPGQLLLTTAQICCVQDLHTFFVTLAATAQSADSFTDGCAPTPSGSRLLPLNQSAIAKSQSTPDFRCFNEFGYSWLHRSSNRNGSSPHKQYIESVIECDFLEPLPRD